MPLRLIGGLLALGLLIAPASAGEEQDRRIPTLSRTVVKGVSSSVGQLGLGMTNLGWFGNLLSPTVDWPSCEYPLNSGAEHLFLGGPWVAAISSEGDTLVSAGAEDTGSNTNTPKQEFGPRIEDRFTLFSTNALSPNFSTQALADEDFRFQFDDLSASGGGANNDPHVPLGIRMHSKALAYAPPYADDFVILQFEAENISGREMKDLYLAWYNELTVGNIRLTIPGSDASPWNFNDDLNGFLAPGDVEDDPDIRMMYCHDDDGEDGRAESWVGIRLLGTSDETSTFSYRQWRFGQIPRFDRDKYEWMSSGQVDSGVGEDGTNFGASGNWISMLAVGPWPDVFPGDRAGFTIAIVCGEDSTAMVRNSQVAQSTFDRGFSLPSGPPSPRIQIERDSHQVTLRWAPGIKPEGDYDPVTASPEYHQSEFTGESDFQGYRVYRIRGEIEGNPFEQASLLAQYDISYRPDGTLDDEGFNTGLPPLDENGMRVFVDENILDGFDYWYAVTSYAAPNQRLDLPELESGFNENASRVTPGTAPREGEDPERGQVGVYPNPYRAAGEFDQRLPGGEPAELGRKIWFTNLPGRARIDIYNLSGSLIDTISHDDPTSGQAAWDILSENTRAIAPGLYIYAVEDLSSGDIQRGKLVILK